MTLTIKINKRNNAQLDAAYLFRQQLANILSNKPESLLTQYRHKKILKRRETDTGARMIKTTTCPWLKQYERGHKCDIDKKNQDMNT